MKKITLLLSTITISALLQGCTADAAMMNGAGSSNSQVNASDVRETSSAIHSGASAIRDVRNLVRGY